MDPREERLRRLAAEHGQGHVFDRYDPLGAEERGRLLDALEQLDFELISDLRSRVTGDAPPPETPSFRPPQIFPLERAPEQDRRVLESIRHGEELLSEGRVGYILVAGGQASRLGSDMPKGCVPVGPVSGRSLFEWHSRRLLAAHRRYGAPTPFYVMTSPVNDAPTREFFEQHAFFGLDPDDVHFFVQGMLPALDHEGRILLRSSSELFLAPNGHGGVLSALRSSGLLGDARARGIETMSYFQVDNPLARPADAFFLGLHHLEEADMSSKVVAKREPGEKVGVLGRVDGKLGCIEYSDLPDELREARDDDGELLFRAGNIAVHAFALDFLDKITGEELGLPWHLARKSMRVLDGDGREADRDGYKFETFVFDALGLAEKSVTLEVDRALEFSPLKNATGEDSPDTVRRDLCKLFAGWARDASLELPPADDAGVHPVEVDPLLAETVEEFRRAAPRAHRTEDGGHLYEEARA